jgi:pimeloyl-ACP methyl ester carboxylesterase
VAFWQADDGSQFYYEQHGWEAPRGGDQRPTLLLLPGLLGWVGEHWQPYVEPLAESYRLLLVDLRGHGRSQNSAPGLLPEQMAADVHGLLRGLGLSGVRLVGYDLGGYLGLLLHLRDPGMVTHLLLHATKFYWTAQAAAAVGQQLDPEVMSERVPGYANRLALAHGAARWRGLVRQAADLNAYLAQNGLQETSLRQVQCQVLVSAGDRDELVSVPEAQRFSRAFKRGALLVLPGVHHPLHTAGLHLFLPAMQAFLSGQEDRRW